MAKTKIGLVLGSGGSRGYLHIGVIKSLIKNNIPIDFIAGCSVGALVGGLYAAKKDISFLEKIAMEHNFSAFLWDPDFNSSFSKGDKLFAFIHDQIADISFSQLKVPFSCVATDIHTGKPVVLNEGFVGESIQASCSIPGIFSPQANDPYLLVDGGISMPVPVSLARDMGANYVIAVNLYSMASPRKKQMQMFSIILKSLDTLFYHLATQNLEKANISIQIPTDDIPLNFSLSPAQRKNLIDLGELLMDQQIPLLQKQLENPIIAFISKKVSSLFKKKDLRTLGAISPKTV